MTKIIHRATVIRRIGKRDRYGYGSVGVLLQWLTLPGQPTNYRRGVCGGIEYPHIDGATKHDNRKPYAPDQYWGQHDIHWTTPNGSTFRPQLDGNEEVIIETT